MKEHNIHSQHDRLYSRREIFREAGRVVIGVGIMAMAGSGLDVGYQAADRSSHRGKEDFPPNSNEIDNEKQPTSEFPQAEHRSGAEIKAPASQESESNASSLNDRMPRIGGDVGVFIGGLAALVAGLVAISVPSSPEHKTKQCS